MTLYIKLNEGEKKNFKQTKVTIKLLCKGLLYEWVSYFAGNFSPKLNIMAQYSNIHYCYAKIPFLYIVQMVMALSNGDGIFYLPCLNTHTHMIFHCDFCSNSKRI